MQRSRHTGGLGTGIFPAAGKDGSVPPGITKEPAPLGVFCLAAWQRNWNFTSGAGFVLVPDKDTGGEL